MNDLPFEEQFIEENVSVRTFDETIDPEELKWHQDDENRIIEVIDGGGGFIIKRF